MMASVSIAARDSLRVSTVSLVSSQDRSSAVRNIHLRPTRTRLTPRVAYSAFSRASASFTSTSLGRRRASAASSSGAPAANSSASSSRNSSDRAAASTTGAPAGSAAAASLLCTITSFLATLGIGTFPLGVCLRVIDQSISIHTDPLAHVERRERLFLMNLGNPFTHQFQRGSERGRHDGRRQRRLDHERNQERVDPRPV